MKIFKLYALAVIISCQSANEYRKTAENAVPIFKKPIKNNGDLFKLDLTGKDNIVKIFPPKNSDFKLPDSSATIETFKIGDFNADKKEDVFVSLGACGTGGCMAALFLKQSNNYYRLVFMDYLKNAEYTVEKNGFWTIVSSEEISSYDPSKIQKTVYKFDKKKYQYKLDTSYVFIDEENAKMMEDLTQ